MKSVSIKLFAALIILFAPVAVKAQDTLIMANGTKVPSKLIEIGPSEVKYKRIDNPDGPTFITDKSEIAIIMYQNGMSDTLKALNSKVAKDKAEIANTASIVDETPKLKPRGAKYMFGTTRIGENQMYRKMLSLNDPQLTKYVRKAKTARCLQFIGIAAVPAIACGVGYVIVTQVSDNVGRRNNSFDYRNGNYTPSIPFFAIGAACLATSVVFKIQYRHANTKIVKLYNEKY